MQEMKEKYLERYLEEEYQIKIERKHKALNFRVISTKGTACYS